MDCPKCGAPTTEVSSSANLRRRQCSADSCKFVGTTVEHWSGSAKRDIPRPAVRRVLRREEQEPEPERMSREQAMREIRGF